MIPKILHYVWLGHGEMSDTMKLCIDSWRKYLPDYQFMLWNEESFDIASAPKFVLEAYEAKKWAFASDYIRLWALHKYGGIYLDTDTEIRKPLDNFLNDNFFIGTQTFPVELSKRKKKIVTNLSIGVIGSIAGHPYLKDCLDRLSQTSILRPDGTIDTTVTNYLMSEILQQYGFKVVDELQKLSEGIIVYPSSVFVDRLSPTDSTDCSTYHWGEMSWFTPKPRGMFFKLCHSLNIMWFYGAIESLRKKFSR